MMSEWDTHPDPYYVRFEKTRVLDGEGRLVGYRMVRYAVNNRGDYIGSVRLARFLCRRLGILPEKITSESRVCMIGRSRDGKWYGWSRWAVYGFQAGDVVEEDDLTATSLPVGFVAHTVDDAKRMAIAYAEAVNYAE